MPKIVNIHIIKTIVKNTLYSFFISVKIEVGSHPLPRGLDYLAKNKYIIRAINKLFIKHIKMMVLF